MRIVALGGLGEIGMNCLLIEAAGRILVIDCGVTFPDHEPGIDVIHPDFTYLLDRADDVEAVVLTHGHEDHIGALPYLLRELDVPVHGPAYALALVKERLAEADLPSAPVLCALAPRQTLELGPFQVTPYRVTHSTPDCTGLVIRTPGHLLVHSGDFKIDLDPVDGEQFDSELLQQVAGEGVSLLMSDSTNVESEGRAGREGPVVDALERAVSGVTGRVVVCLFASNVQRLDAALAVAQRVGRRVLLLGRSLQTHARISREHGLLQHDPGVLVEEDRAQHVPRGELMIIATGSQAEPRSALNRMAAGTHHRLTLEAGDEVVLSSRVIPGRERTVNGMINDLERRGIRVHSRRDDPELHVSGHACREEQRTLIELVRPRAFLPVHGTYLHLRRHAELARDAGIAHTLAVENGRVAELNGHGLRVVDEIRTGRVHIQWGEPISSAVLRDRGHMAEGGLVIVQVRVARDGSLVGRPHVVTRGVVDAEDEADLGVADDCSRAVARALRRLDRHADDATIDNAVGRAARRVFRDALGWRPLVHTLVSRAEP